MFRHQCGLWVPDGNYGERFFAKNASDGLPIYGYDLLKKALKQCRSFRTAIDGGAYIGAITLRLERKFKRVIAFEPVMKNFECLAANVVEKASRLGDAQLSNQALSFDHVKMSAMPDSKNHCYGTRFIADANGKYNGIPIDSLDLDDLDFLKLDVEGHEREVLEGAGLTLKRCSPVIVLEDKPPSSTHAIDFLIRKGYKLSGAWRHDYIYRKGD